jgi:hypothetical protein
MPGWWREFRQLAGKVAAKSVGGANPHMAGIAALAAVEIGLHRLEFAHNAAGMGQEGTPSSVRQARVELSAAAHAKMRLQHADPPAHHHLVGHRLTRNGRKRAAFRHADEPLESFDQGSHSSNCV